MSSNQDIGTAEQTTQTPLIDALWLKIDKSHKYLLMQDGEILRGQFLISLELLQKLLKQERNVIKANFSPYQKRSESS